MQALSRNGRFLLPFVVRVEGFRLAVDELVDVAVRATIEAIGKHVVVGSVGVDAAGNKHIQVWAKAPLRMPQCARGWWWTWWRAGLTPGGSTSS